MDTPVFEFCKENSRFHRLGHLYDISESDNPTHITACGMMTESTGGEFGSLCQDCIEAAGASIVAAKKKSAAKNRKRGCKDVAACD